MPAINGSFNYGKMEFDPVAKPTKSKDKGPVTPPLGMTTYDRVRDDGVHAQARMQDQATTSRQKASYMESIGAGITTSITANVIKKFTRESFEPEEGFDYKQFIMEDTTTASMGLNREEVHLLKSANSTAEARSFVKEINKQREIDQMLGDHVSAAIIGGVLGDSWTIFVPVGAARMLPASAANWVRITANAAEVSGAVWTHDELGQSEVNTYIVGSIAMLDSLVALKSLGNINKLKLRDAEAAAEAPYVANTTNAVVMPPHLLGETADTVDPARAAALRAGKQPKRGKHSNRQFTPKRMDTTNSVSTNPNRGLALDPDMPTIPPTTADLVDDLGVGRVTRAVTPKRASAAEVEVSIKNSNLDAVVDTTVGRATDDISTGVARSAPTNLRQALDVALRSFQSADGGYLRGLRDAIVKAMPDTGMTVQFIKADARAYAKVATNGAVEIHIPLPKAARNQGSMSMSEALSKMSSAEARVFMHEAIHATSAQILRKIQNGGGSAIEKAAVRRMESTRNHLRQLMRDGKIKGTEGLEYHTKSLDEFVAGLANSKELQKALMGIRTFQNTESLMRKVIKDLMMLLGMQASSRTAFTEMIDAFHDVMTGTSAMKQARSVPAPVSLTMKRAMSGIEDVFHHAPAGSQATSTAQAMKEKFVDVFKSAFMLHGQISRGNKDLADLLVANPLLEGSRRTAVADIVRNLRVEFGVPIKNVEDSLYVTAKEHFGVNWLDMALSRRKYRDAIQELQEEATMYLHKAYQADINGIPVPPAPARIQKVIDAYTESGFAKKWLERGKSSGVIDGTANIKPSKYYLPVSYSPDKVRLGIRTGRFTEQGVQNLLKSAIKETFPHLSAEFQHTLATKWYRSMTESTQKVTSAWRAKAAAGAEQEITTHLRALGIDDVTIDSILKDKALLDTMRPQKNMKNLRSRANFDHLKRYDVGNGQSMSLNDIIDTNMMRNMDGYSVRMSGAVAFKEAGIDDMSQLAKMVDEARLSLPRNVDEATWIKYVDDSIDQLLGYAPRGHVPIPLRSLGMLTNATVLKNSGIYGVTDISLGLQELGMRKVFRAMVTGGLWKDFRKAVGSNEQAERFFTLLNAGVKNDMRFKKIHTYTEDMLDMSDQRFLSVAQNAANLVHNVNGLKAVHSGMANMYSGIIYDMFQDLMKHDIKMVNGVIKVPRGAKASYKSMTKFGLSPEDIMAMRREFAANPNALFSKQLQAKLETSSQRLMDYLLQQQRLGELPHMASLNPLGRVIIGYNSFALGTTTRALGRMVANEDYVGLVTLAAYQMPLMLMASYAKAALDGKADEVTFDDMLLGAMSNASMFGVLAPTFNIFFSPNQPSQGLAMLGLYENMKNVINDISNGRTPRVTSVLPLTQTNIVFRAIINNFNSED